MITNNIAVIELFHETKSKFFKNVKESIQEYYTKVVAAGQIITLTITQCTISTE